MLRYLVCCVIMLMSSGCATLQGNVTVFHTLDTSPRTFVILPFQGQEGSLEFFTYSNLVSEQLISRGWRPDNSDAAEIALFLQYQISQGRLVQFTYPILGQVPTGSYTTTGTMSMYGNTGTFYANTQQNTTLGMVGTGVGSRVEYDRAVQIAMYSAPAFRETQKWLCLFESTIRSTGSTGDLPTVMPTLIRGLFRDFPGKSGTTRSFSLFIK